MEKSIKGTRTEQNLLKAFAGESQARSRYVFFASKAKKEGYEQIAGVFAETAEQEKEHAERFFKFLEGGDVEITASYPTGPIGTTAENLLAAAHGEKEEWDVLYREFAKVAEPYIRRTVKGDFDIAAIAALLQARCERLSDIPEKVDFFSDTLENALPNPSSIVSLLLLSLIPNSFCLPRFTSSLGISRTNLETLLYCVSPRIIRCWAEVIVRCFFALVIPT